MILIRRGVSQFYKKRYDYAAKEVSDVSFERKKLMMFIARSISNYGKHVKASSLLDIGCGNGIHTMVLKLYLGVDEAYGVDVVEEFVRHANQKGISALKLNIDTQSLPFRENCFDIIFCGETIEHVFDTDHLLSEAHRVLKTNGVFCITAPNLSAWVNRILLLFGYQPLGAEGSLRYDVGRPRFLISQRGPAGHIKVFTSTALVELLKIHGFTSVKLHVFTMQLSTISRVARLLIRLVDVVLTRLSPSLSFLTVAVCSKK